MLKIVDFLIKIYTHNTCFQTKKRFLLDRPVLKNGGLFDVTYLYWLDTGVCPFPLRRDRPVWSVY